MLRLASVLVVGATALAGAAPARDLGSAGARAGRVVRVERTAAAHDLRLCFFYDRTVGEGICLGGLQRGDKLAIAHPGRRSLHGAYRVDHTADASSELGMCATGVALTKVRGSFGDVLDDASELVGLRGVTFGVSARFVADQASPTGRASDDVLLAVDSDGRGRADLIVIRYGCDAAGQSSPVATAQCFDIYRELGTRLQRVRHDHIQPCR